MVAVFRLQLNDEGNLSVYQRQDVRKLGDGVFRVFQTVIFQVLRIQVFDAPGLPGGAVEQGVVHHAKVAVFQQMQIKLHAVAVLHGQTEGGHGVFGGIVAVKAAVGIVPAPQFLHARVAAPSLNGQHPQQRENQYNYQQSHNCPSKALIVHVKGIQPLFRFHLVIAMLQKPMVTKDANTKMAA